MDLAVIHPQQAATLARNPVLLGAGAGYGWGFAYARRRTPSKASNFPMKLANQPTIFLVQPRNCFAVRAGLVHHFRLGACLMRRSFSISAISRLVLVAASTFL